MNSGNLKTLYRRQANEGVHYLLTTMLKRMLGIISRNSEKHSAKQHIINAAANFGLPEDVLRYASIWLIPAHTAKQSIIGSVKMKKPPSRSSKSSFGKGRSMELAQRSGSQ
jgi:hypothetical protein